MNLNPKVIIRLRLLVQQADCLTDVYTIWWLASNDHLWWMGVSIYILLQTAVVLLCLECRDFIYLRNFPDAGRPESSTAFCLRTVSLFLLVRPLVELLSPFEEDLLWRCTRMAYLEGVFEAFPQTVLQFYIILTLDEVSGWSLVSLAFSFISAGLLFTKVAMAENEDDPRPSALHHNRTQFCAAVAVYSFYGIRVLCFAMFAACFSGYVFAVMGVSLAATYAFYLFQRSRHNWTDHCSISLSNILCFIACITPVHWFGMVMPHWMPWVFSGKVLLENGLMLTFSAWQCPELPLILIIAVPILAVIYFIGYCGVYWVLGVSPLTVLGYTEFEGLALVPVTFKGRTDWLMWHADPDPWLWSKVDVDMQVRNHDVFHSPEVVMDNHGMNQFAWCIVVRGGGVLQFGDLCIFENKYKCPAPGTQVRGSTCEYTVMRICATPSHWAEWIALEEKLRFLQENTEMVTVSGKDYCERGKAFVKHLSPGSNVCAFVCSRHSESGCVSSFEVHTNQGEVYAWGRQQRVVSRWDVPDGHALTGIDLKSHGTGFYGIICTTVDSNGTEHLWRTLSPRDTYQKNTLVRLRGPITCVFGRSTQHLQDGDIYCIGFSTARSLPTPDSGY